MTIDLGRKLGIRSMIYVAGEPVPFFWPMRAFIHHNPLHGLEHLPFEQAVRRGEDLFHARGFLKRRQYQDYLRQGRVDATALTAEISAFCRDLPEPHGLDWRELLLTLVTETPEPATEFWRLASAADILDVLHGKPLADAPGQLETIQAELGGQLLGDRPVYEAVDGLYCTRIASDLDELVVNICLDFFDEGHSVWEMPERDGGLFRAWRSLTQRNRWPSRRNRRLKEILAISDEPEVIIAHAMERLKVPEQRWMGYFSRELSRLHGWAGFIRWRSQAKHYYWQRRYPADLVDLLAVRLTLTLALLAEAQRPDRACDAEALAELIEQAPEATYLRHERGQGRALPRLAQQLEETLARGDRARIQAFFRDYVRAKREAEALHIIRHGQRLAERLGRPDLLSALAPGELEQLLDGLRRFERHEGMIWLAAMEGRAIDDLLKGVRLEAEAARPKRPFVQALFCIDTRSERIRRRLEGIGDYQTYGIAGFFGVPISFMELGKGSEQHLCPVLLTPKNLVIEMSCEAPPDQTALTALEKAMHELKESVLTPFVTVEAIGLLFGLDMVGKTVAPRGYHRWRNRLHHHKPLSHLLLDKLTEHQADSIIRAAQRAIIVKAVELELGLSPEQITDDLVRALRETALGPEDAEHADLSEQLCEASRAVLNLPDKGAAFLKRLRRAYRINRDFAHRQIEQLSRIGFTLDEQANYVLQALKSIGLVRGFSRFVLLIGHGSASQNNPYESALDCGACGGAHGLTNARVLAQMANNPRVRKRLQGRGLVIADDSWFLPAFHNTTTDEISLHDLERLPPSHVIYLDRLRSGLIAAARLCAQERIPTLNGPAAAPNPASAALTAQRNALDWSQVRPEWGLSGNAYFIIARRQLTRGLNLEGRAFLHSYDYREDPKRRLLENILTGPLVVGQWINMEHYFSTVDNEAFGSGSKVYHNVAGNFGVMTGNQSDLRTGLPAQTVLKNGEPYHQPMRLITLIQAPFEHARKAIEAVTSVKYLVLNHWIRILVLDPESQRISLYEGDEWAHQISRGEVPSPENRSSPPPPGRGPGGGSATEKNASP